jgi:ATP-dependent helicase HrpB
VRTPLPIDEALPALLAALARAPAAVLKAPPGAGKTTRVPPALLGLSEGLVLLLEPRRLAARASAKRMADERGEPLGKTVGYQVRFDERRSKDTRILVLTEGILTRRFLDDPLLEGVGCVILDEFHERSVHTDLCLAFCKELLQVRDDLKLVVMSATLEEGPLSAFLGGCPVITSEGRRFPVTVQHLGGRDERPLEVRMRGALRSLVVDEADDGGDVLAFLPGAPEIERTRRALEQEPLPGAPELLPLYGSLSPEAQDRALSRGRSRRVILATNIAETSLTLEGVTAVVDAGLVKRVQHDPRTGLERLETVRVSRYSAEQRAGRAGRTAPGRVLRLWSEAEHGQLAEQDAPELFRADLAAPLLQVLAFHPGELHALPFFEPPPAAHVTRAAELLRLLGAVHDEGGRLSLSDAGRALARLPLHPRLGAVLLAGARLQRVDEAAALCALLSERDILRHRAALDAGASSELEHRLEVLFALEAEGFSRGAAQAYDADERAAREIARVKDQLARLGRGLPRGQAEPKLPEERARARMLLAGFPDRVCARAGEGTGRMVGGRGVALPEGSPARGSALFVALELDDKGVRSLVRSAFSLERGDLEGALPHLLHEEQGADLAGERGAVVGVVRRRFADLVLDERRGGMVSPAVGEAVLAAAARARFAELFRPNDEARAYFDRLRFAAKALPEEEWPALDEASLRERLAEQVAGKRSLAELAAADWRAVVEAELSWQQRQLLDAEVPARLEVPSGSLVGLDYAAALAPDGAPVLAVRLQEVFGLTETPRVAKGRVPVLLHLLAPNMRPVQVTRDLRSFWDKTYEEVRKELRRRYPRHSWPDDPWEAQAVRGPRRRRP